MKCNRAVTSYNCNYSSMLSQRLGGHAHLRNVAIFRNLTLSATLVRYLI